MNRVFTKDFLIKIALVIPLAVLIYFFGIKPLFNGNTPVPTSTGKNILDSSKFYDNKNIYDVIVVGEEPEGIAAAVSSSILGARTLLISEDDMIGGKISRCLLTDMEISKDSKGKRLNKNILSAILDKSGKDFSIDNYESGIASLIKKEKNLEVVYGAGIKSPILDGNALTGVEVYGKSNSVVSYTGRRFIDATKDGKLLEMCEVPYFSGSEDLNLRNTYSPARLNFEVEGANWSKFEDYMRTDNEDFSEALDKYEPLSCSIRISDFNITDQGNGKAIVQGIEIRDFNAEDKQSIDKAYKAASQEAESLFVFLKTQFKDLKNIKMTKTADELYVREARHFKGEYVLSVNDIVKNRYFENTIALGTYPVISGKLTSSGTDYTIGKPVQYSIPLGCIIPEKTENLLMVGSKISYSSLASSSAGTLDVGIETGEAAGIIAAYSISEDSTPRNISNRKDTGKIQELQQLFKAQGLDFPRFSINISNISNWSYPAVEQLNSLGLLAAGEDNNYEFSVQARQADLVTLLLNGTYRLSPGKYSLELDARLSPYSNNRKLTKQVCAEILASFHGIDINTSEAYPAACQSNFINNVMQLRLKDKNVLTMDDVYYLSAYNIKLFTGKDIKE